MESVDLAARKHRRECLRLADRLHLDVGRQVEPDLLRSPRLFFSAGVVSHAVDWNTKVLGQDATDPIRESGPIRVLGCNLSPSGIDVSVGRWALRTKSVRCS